MRNNLYLGKNSSANNSYFICEKHPERRFPVMFTCEPVKVLTAKVIQILKNAGLLRLGDNMQMFLWYHHYNLANRHFVWYFILHSMHNNFEYLYCILRNKLNKNHGKMIFCIFY